MADGGDKRFPTPTWINEEFIQTALRSGDQDQTITVLSIKVNHGSSAGDNYASNMYRVSCEVMNDSGGPETRSLIIKCNPQAGIIDNFLNILDAFSREAFILTKILPAMFQLLEKSSPVKYHPFSARCLYYGENPTKFIVLEDLKPLGFQMADRCKGLDLSHCLLTIKTLARFHAASTALLSNNPSALDKFEDGLFCERMRETFSGFLIAAITSLSSAVETWPEFREQKYAERILALKDTFFDRLMEVCRRKEDGWYTLVHSDLWVNNIMFKYGGDTVEALRIIDYQLSCRGSPSTDLLFFLYTSPTEEVRVAHMDHLLHVYVTEYNATLGDLNCGQKRISFQMLEETLEEHLLFGFYAAISELPIMISDPDDNFDIELVFKNTENESPNHDKRYASEMYVKIMKRLLPIFDKKGIF